MGTNVDPVCGDDKSYLEKIAGGGVTPRYLGTYQTLAALKADWPDSMGASMKDSWAMVAGTQYTYSAEAGVGWVEQGGSSGLTAIQRIKDTRLHYSPMWGDSTVEQLAGLSLLPYAIGVNNNMANLSGCYVKMSNHGANGQTSAAILSSTNAVNAGSNPISPENLGEFARANGATFLQITIGINDFRQNPNILTYGNAAWVAEILAFQTRVASMVSRFRAIAGDIPVVLIVPNTLVNDRGASGYYANGVTGTIATVAIRAGYIGDEYYGIQRLDALILNSAVCDAGRAVFGQVVPSYINRPSTMDDELHPNGTGYKLRFAYVARWLYRICLQSEDVTIATGNVNYSASNAFYINIFSPTIASLWGGSSGGYGATRCPGLGVGDEILATTVSGIRRRLRVTRVPDETASNTSLRWYTGGPDGFYHPELVTGDRIEIIRKRLETVWEAIGDGFKSYPFRVVSGGAGTATIKAVIGGAYSLLDRAPTTNDFIGLCGIGGTLDGTTIGRALTAATIGAGANPGEFTIAIAGVDFSTSVNQIGSIMVQQ